MSFLLWIPDVLIHLIKVVAYYISSIDFGVMRVFKVMEAAFESDRVGAPIALNDVGVIDPQ